MKKLKARKPMGLYDRPSTGRMSATFLLLLVSLFFVVKGIEIADATQELPAKPPVNGAQDTDLSKSIETTLKAEEENLRQLKEQLSQVQSVKESVDKELDAYKLQMWSHSSLFLLPTSQVSELEEELSLLAKEFSLLGTGDFWLGQTRALWPSGWLSLITFFLLLGFLYFIFLRLRHFCHLLEQRPVMRSRPWGSLTLKLLQRSLPLLGITVFLYTYAQVRLIYSGVPLIRVMVYVLLIWLFCRWESDLLKMWQKGENPRIPESLMFRLRAIILAVRAFATAYVIVAWTIEGAGAILFVARACLEVAFLAWSVSFWKIFGREFARAPLRESRFFSVATPLFIGLDYAMRSPATTRKF